MSDSTRLDRNEDANRVIELVDTGLMVSSGNGPKRTKDAIRGKFTDTQEFGCMSDDCGKTSPLRYVEWYSGKYVIECPHCCQWHELRRLETPRGAPMQFEIVGMLESE